MTIQATPCDRLPLERLLADDEVAVDPQLTEHVAHCAACQARLAALAGDESWWSTARESLSGSSELDWKPDQSWASLSGPTQRTDRGQEITAIKHLLAPASHPELMGRIGRYDVERVIGAGGMGVVLKAHDTELNRPIAVKVLAGHLSHVGAARERFAREGRAAAAVVHEHVVAIYNVETSGEVPFLVMQYVPGRSLQARVDADGPLAVEEILRIGMQAASGLAAAHAQGLVHRDVKPSNILLEESVERAVLTDFGLARTINDASLTHTGFLAGTPHYMSPEQASGAAIDHRSDLFSLGAVLYFMATGHPPFRADGALAVLHRICREPHRPVWQANKDVPDELSDVIDQLLEKKPNHRPPTAADVSATMAQLLSRYQQYGLSSHRLPRWTRGFRKHGTRLAVVAGTLVAATAIALTAYLVGLPAFLTGATQEAVNGLQHEDRGIGNEAIEQALVATEETNRAIEQMAELDGQYAEEFTAAHAALSQSERPTAFSSSGEDPWFQDIEGLRRDLSELESQQDTSLSEQE
jgi:hypothetical protein